jgi:hypothetical protein
VLLAGVTAVSRRPVSAVRIRVQNPGLLPDLAAFLRSRIDAVVEELNEHELAVNLLGSRERSQMKVELERRLSGWRLRHPLAVVAIVDEAELDGG